jgi:hypothetical protein
MRLAVGGKLGTRSTQSSEQRVQMPDSLSPAYIAFSVPIEVFVVQIAPLLLIHANDVLAASFLKLCVVAAVCNVHE